MRRNARPNNPATESRPVLIDPNGVRQLYLFPNITVAGQCTAKAKSHKGERCGNVVGPGPDHGIHHRVRRGRRCTAPYLPVRAIAAALRGHLAPAERGLLAHLLTAKNA
ncbi:hypothetical protein [Microbispora hainanensis]|uniref:Uncharacterized protein n=1 Tax=Microbispora hainanensis TaxID=568844 RepID=A0ABZ1SUG6_9ACTN|nr:hypothetical protein [Microbispora hainanensis]